MTYWWNFLDVWRMFLWRVKVDLISVLRAHGDLASIFPRIVSLGECMFNSTLRQLNLEIELSAYEIHARRREISIRSPRSIAQHTAISLPFASASPYPALIFSRALFWVAIRFRSLQHIHHSACRSSQDLCRSSSTVQGRPRRNKVSLV